MPVLHLVLHEHHHHKSKANQLISVTPLRIESWKLSMQVTSQQNQQIMQVKISHAHVSDWFSYHRKSPSKSAAQHEKQKLKKKAGGRQVKNWPLVGTKAVFLACLKTICYHTLSYHSAFEPLSKEGHPCQAGLKPAKDHMLKSKSELQWSLSTEEKAL